MSAQPKSSGDRGGRGRGAGQPRGRYRGRPFWLNKPLADPVVEESEVNYCNMMTETTCPLKGWNLYFPDENYESSSVTTQNVLQAIRYFERHSDSISLKEIEAKNYYNLDLTVVQEDTVFMNSWPNFIEDLREKPDHSLNCLGLAFHHVVNNMDSNEEDFEFPQLYIRIKNFKPVVSLRDIKACLYGKLISVKGTVIRVGPSRLLCTRMGFACTQCRTPQVLTLKDGVYITPKSCPLRECRSKTFSPLHSSHLTKTKNFQIVKIQDMIGDCDAHSAGGRVPRNIEVEFVDDLVDKCCPGDSVIITGIVKVNTSDEGKRKNSPNLFTLFLEGVSVTNSKGSGGRYAQANLEFTLKDYYAIQELHDEKSLWRLLVNSICPNVYGHELVKAGLLLSLVGGATQGTGQITKRPLIHVLIVGDPGLGKSHMLTACSTVAPRGVYVCGNTTSASGLTVTLTKEAGGDFALEAGALVLANHGVCCIDEFDKMSSQHQALLEAMEQERLSVAKGGVVCSLPAHTTIIAAANPAGGHYNKSKSLVENLRMSSPLLSRFDLIFVLLDKPNEHLDSLLSEHVMELHAGLKKKKVPMYMSSLSLSSCLDETIVDNNMTLLQRLKIPPNEHIELIPHQLLRKYIAYVKKYVPSPRLSPEAANVLQKFYLELREKSKQKDSTPITTRQLESMIRLTEARVKVELREEATERDARDVIELMNSTLMDIYSDSDVVDSRKKVGSQTSRAKKFIAGLQQKSSLENKTLFTLNELRELSKVLNIQVPDFFSFIETLNNQGFLLKKPNKCYQLMTV
ncbi:DNA helicase MCM8-like [Cimex lectularius]|uniref:DNA helicase MCM8 n=1 Tax=Cimex lectularius TaxID=79782 RepID=A0A8I6TKF0_CIMLE|nr:DNA helicase MCM8-like [Cimex lectularius]